MAQRPQAALRVPVLGQQAGERRMGRADRRRLRDEAGALRDPMMMAVDGQSRLPQHRERQHRGTRLRANSWNALEPRPRLRDRHGIEEIEREAAMSLLDGVKHRLGQVTP